MAAATFWTMVLRWTRIVVFTYYMIMLPFRFAYQTKLIKDIEFVKGRMLLDYLADAFFIIDSLYTFRSTMTSVSPDNNSDDSDDQEMEGGGNKFVKASSISQREEDDDEEEEEGALNSILSARKLTRLFKKFDFTKLISLSSLFIVLPYELIGLAAGFEDFYFLRSIRFFQILRFHGFYYDILNEYFPNGAQIKRVGFLAFYMALTVNLFGCAFYFIALKSLEISDDITWLTWPDKFMLVMIRYTETDDGTLLREIVFLEDLFKRYIRAIYWSTQTITTVGYGDICARTDGETWLCTVYFFVAASFMYFSISNVALLIGSMDSAKLEYLEKIQKFRKYVKFRNLPSDLVNRVISYYDYQWETLGGANEQEILDEIPLNLKEQLNQEMVRNKLVKYHAFSNLNILQLNSISDQSEIVSFCANDVIFNRDSKINGMYIIVKGEFLATNEDNVSRIIRVGDSFGSTTLYKSSSSLFSIKAKTFAECLFIKGTRFRQICSTLMTSEEYENQLNIVSEAGPTDILEVTLQKRRRGVIVDTLSSKKISEDLNIYSKDLARIDLIIPPEAVFLKIWSFFKLLGVIFYMFTIPLLLVGSSRQYFVEHYLWMLVVSYVFDLVFLVDVILSMTLFAFYKNGAIETSAAEIFHNFIRKNNMYVVALSIFPLDVIVGSIMGPVLIPVCRLLKLFHTANLSTYAGEVNTYLANKTGILISFNVGRAILLYFLLFTLCHWCGCIWVLSATLSVRFFDFPLNWIMVDQNNKELGFGLLLDIDGSSFFGWCTYFRSIYWALSGMTSIACPDIFAQNIVESIVVIVIFFFGCQILNGLDGGIATLIMSFGKDKTEHYQKYSSMKEIIKTGGCSQDIEERIGRYADYQWVQKEGILEDNILSSLSKGLVAQIKSEFLREIIENIPFFHNCKEILLDFIITLLKPRVFLDGDPICTAGEYGKELYIIESGSIMVTNANKTVTYATLKRGDYLGESCLLKVSKRTASAYAVGYCNIYTFSKEDFFKVYENFRDEFEQIQPIIEQVLQDKQKKNQVNQEKNLEIESDKKKESRSSRATNTAKVAPDNDNDDDDDDAISAAKIIADNFNALIMRIQSFLMPESYLRSAWQSILWFVTVYYLFIIPIRLSVELPISFFAVDYVFDLAFILNAVLIANLFPYSEGGDIIQTPSLLRSRYYKQFFLYDILVCFPYEIFFFASSLPAYTILSLLRIPKFFRILSLGEYSSGILIIIEYVGLPETLLKLIALTFTIILFGFYTGGGYLILANNRNSGDCVPEPDAPYKDACQYRNTWIQLQISMNRIAPGGGTAFDRFIMSIYFTIPLLTKITMAEVVPLNEKESLYVVCIIFLGLAVNGSILGNVIALIQKPIKPLKSKAFSIECEIGVTCPLIEPGNLERGADYLDYMTSDEANLLWNRGVLIELPFSICQAIDKEMKLIPFLRRCSIFDSLSDQICYGICSRLQLCIYCLGDEIITFGELGHEMYFIESGSVEVCSGDGKTVYTTLSGSGFFGETALFFKSPRMATIRCSSQFCVTYRLNKSDMDAEILSYDFDVESMIKAFTTLQEGNRRRNVTLMTNLNIARNDKKSKLARVLGDVDDPMGSSARDSFFLKLRKKLTPHSPFRVVWNLFGFAFLCYFAFIIPFNCVFLVDKDFDDLNYFTFDFIIDVYFVIDILMKTYCFSVLEEAVGLDVLITDRYQLWDIYKDTFKLDVLASLPLELFYLIPGVPKILLCWLRVHHIIRVLQINQYSLLLQETILYYTEWAPKATLAMVIKSALLWIYTGHILACIWFFLHRYLERESEFTFATFDGMSTYNGERHDICFAGKSRCYSRSLYFVLSTMSSNGYGDVIPFGNIEYIFQILIAIIGAFVGALYAAYCGSYIQGNDESGESLYQDKLAMVKRYLTYRSVSKDLSESIVANYELLWQNYRSIGTGAGHVFNELSQPTKVLLCTQMYSGFMSKLTIMNSFDGFFRNKLCAIFQPQAVLPGRNVYRCGDTGRTLFFIKNGAIKLTLNDKAQNELDAFGKDCLPLLQSQLSVIGDRRTTGNHFGEFSLLSKTGLRSDAATAITFTELLAVNESDLWQILLTIKNEDKRNLIGMLFTWNKDKNHTTVEWNGDISNYDKLKSISNFSYEVLKEIILFMYRNKSPFVTSTHRIIQVDDNPQGRTTQKSMIRSSFSHSSAKQAIKFGLKNQESNRNRSETMDTLPDEDDDEEGDDDQNDDVESKEDDGSSRSRQSSISNSNTNPGSPGYLTPQNSFSSSKFDSEGPIPKIAAKQNALKGQIDKVRKKSQDYNGSTLELDEANDEP